MATARRDDALRSTESDYCKKHRGAAEKPIRVIVPYILQTAAMNIKKKLKEAIISFVLAQ